MSFVAFGLSIPLSKTCTTQPRSLHYRVLSPRQCPRAETTQPQPIPTLIPSDSSASTLSTPSSVPLYQCSSCKFSLPPVSASSLPKQCPSCSIPIPRNSSYTDLTATPLSAPPAFQAFLNQLRQPRAQSMFQLTPVSGVYERGWRDQFEVAGFPGIEKEYRMLQDFIPSGTILDVSCGTALMARRLAVNPAYSRVVALDYSHAMLVEAAKLAAQDIQAPKFEIVRGDVAKLPFVDNSFDGVHAGAALHCWPSLQDGIAETLRVLKPGGTVFATTFLRGLNFTFFRDLAYNPTLRRLASELEDAVPNRNPFRFFDAEELERLFKVPGFVDVDVTSDKGFVLVKCKKRL